MERLLQLLRENPPTVGEAAAVAYVAAAYWVSTLVPPTVPDYVVWALLVLFVVVGLGLIGRLTQRWTIPVEWLDHDTARDLMRLDPDLPDDFAAALEHELADGGDAGSIRPPDRP